MYNNLKFSNVLIAFKNSVLLFIGAICFFSHSQDYDVSKIKVNNNNYSVYLTKKLYLDDDGFLWYSTKNGIVKEMGNGKNFFFEYAIDKEKHDPVLICNALLKSSKDQIWSCTNHGVNILDLKSRTSRWIELNFPETENLVMFTDIAEDALGNIWLATDKNYIYRYSPNNKLISYKLNDSEYDPSNTLRYSETKMKITNVLKDNSLVLHQNNKWIHFKDEKSKVIYVDSKDVTNKKTPSITVPNGSIFTSNSSGSYKHKNKVYHYKYLPEINKQIIENPFSNLEYIPVEINKNFNNAINFYAVDGKNFSLLKMKKKDSNIELIEQNIIPFKHTITNAIYDNNGYFWLHTEDGLHKIRYNDIGFKKHINNKNLSCRNFTETKNGTIYVFTYQGVFKKEKNETTFKPLENINDTKTYRILKNGSHGFYNYKDEYLLFYGYHDSLIELNLITEKLKTYKTNQAINTVDAEYIGDDKLLLANSNGLFSFNLKTKEFNNENKLNDGVDLTNITINCITLSKDKNTLWIATSGKNTLIKLDVKSKNTSVFNINSKTFPLIDKDIKIIYEDTENNIWLGSSNGLQKVHPKTYEYFNYNTLSGLINANITGILEDNKSFWISTYNGLVKLDKAAQSIQTYYETDGITHNEFNAKSFYKSTTDGTLYFGGLNGITSFNPDEISNKTRTYKIVLTDYELFDKEKKENVLTRTLLENKINQFNIPYLQNYLTLNFSINDIFNAENNVYQYRIIELSKEWIDLGNYSKIELRGLKPGKYNLEVRGYSSNGNATNTLKYNVNINQIMYKKTWFVVLLILSVFVFVTIRNILRRQRLQRHFDLKSKIQELESKAMRAQMNPHFLFNTLNGMQSVMLLKGERAANKYFTSFSKLLRLTLDMSNNEYVLLKHEIQYLKSYLELENLRLDNKVDIQFNVDSNLDIENYSIPCMLFQPIVENAIIHGLSPKKDNLKLVVNFKKEAHKLVGEIIDNGIGRDEAGKLNKKINKDHKSWATEIMNERIKTANSINDEKITWSIIDLFDDRKHAKGTKVTLSIPLKKVT